MKIFITSDTHRGFSHKTARIHDRWLSSPPDFDVMLLCGDLATNKKKQFYKALRFYRRVAENRPILLVRGNHDFQDASLARNGSEWINKQKSLISLLKLHEEWFLEFDIHCLDTMGAKIIDNVFFAGWDGWFNYPLKDMFKLIEALSSNAEQPYPYPNDMERLPSHTAGIPTFDWMREKSEVSFKKALEVIRAGKDNPNIKKIIAATHFPPFITEEKDKIYHGNPCHLKQLSGLVDILFYGHSHEEMDTVLDDVRVINAGSDYNKPKFKIIEI